MFYNYNKLKRRIAKVCGNTTNFAKLIGMPEHLLALKFCNKIAFTQCDIHNVCNVLKINNHDIPAYFFTFNVQNIEH